MVIFYCNDCSTFNSTPTETQGWPVEFLYSKHLEPKKLSASSFSKNNVPFFSSKFIELTLKSST